MTTSVFTTPLGSSGEDFVSEIDLTVEGIQQLIMRNAQLTTENAFLTQFLKLAGSDDILLFMEEVHRLSIENSPTVKRFISKILEDAAPPKPETFEEAWREGVPPADIVVHVLREEDGYLIPAKFVRGAGWWNVEADEPIHGLSQQWKYREEDIHPARFGDAEGVAKNAGFETVAEAVDAMAQIGRS